MDDTTPTMGGREALRIQLGLSVAELARRAGISVDTVRKILKGQEGQVTKVKAVDEALSRAGQEKGLNTTVVSTGQAAEPGPRSALVEDELMEFEVGGNFGVSVVVRGPVKDHEALENAVLKLIQGMNSPAAAPAVTTSD